MEQLYRRYITEQHGKLNTLNDRAAVGRMITDHLINPPERLHQDQPDKPAQFIAELEEIIALSKKIDIRALYSSSTIEVKPKGDWEAILQQHLLRKAPDTARLTDKLDYTDVDKDPKQPTIIYNTARLTQELTDSDCYHSVGTKTDKLVITPEIEKQIEQATGIPTKQLLNAHGSLTELLREQTEEGNVLNGMNVIPVITVANVDPEQSSKYEAIVYGDPIPFPNQFDSLEDKKNAEPYILKNHPITYRIVQVALISASALAGVGAAINVYQNTIKP